MSGQYPAAMPNHSSAHADEDAQQRAKGEMSLLCFQIFDEAGRSKFLAINVLRTQEVCMYTQEIRDKVISVGKSGSGGVIHGSFPHRGEIVSAVDLRAWMYGKRGENYDQYVVVRGGNCLMAFLSNSNPDPFTVSAGSWISHELGGNPLYAGGKCERAAEMLSGAQAGALVDIVDLDQLVHDLNPGYFDEKLALVQPVSGVGRKVLLVDDSITARKHAAKTFTHAGFRDSQIFSTPEDLFGHLKSIGPEAVGIVVTDLEMARGMGGEGLIRAIRSEERFAGLPILVYSGMLDENRRRIVLELGATDFVDKGNPQELVDKIHLHALAR